MILSRRLSHSLQSKPEYISHPLRLNKDLKPSNKLHRGKN